MRLVVARPVGTGWIDDRGAVEELGTLCARHLSKAHDAEDLRRPGLTCEVRNSAPNLGVDIDQPGDGAHGLRFAASKCYERGVRDEAFWQMIRDNPGVSGQTMGVLEAQVEVSRMGAALYCELLQRFGSETMRRVIEDYC
jgi:hypothetical protein